MKMSDDVVNVNEQLVQNTMPWQSLTGCSQCCTRLTIENAIIFDEMNIDEQPKMDPTMNLHHFFIIV